MWKARKQSIWYTSEDGIYTYEVDGVCLIKDGYRHWASVLKRNPWFIEGDFSKAYRQWVELNKDKS